VTGFLANHDSVYESMDEDNTEWLEFLSALHDLFGAEPFEAKDLVHRLGAGEIDPGRLPSLVAEGFGKPNFAKVLGRAFAKKHEARYDEYRIVRVSPGTKSKKAVRWKIVQEEEGV